MKKRTAILLCLLLVLSLLTACGSTRTASTSTADYAAETAAAAAKGDGYAAANENASDSVSVPAGAAETASAGDGSADLSVTDKIIYSADLSLESTEFDQAVASIESMVTEFGGYIQSSSVNGDSRYNEDGTTSIVNRYACYTIAVPSESFEEFLQRSGGVGNVLSQNRYAENISSQYTDTEARIESLQTQYDRLLAMMEKSTDVESLVALEERLSEVTYELESYERTLKDWDRQVAYSTITLNLQEVELYTPTASVTRTFGEKLGDALKDGWSGFVRGLQRVLIFLVGALPALLLLAAIAVFVPLIIRKAIKRRAARKFKKSPPDAPTQ
ncbi:MAG: DUF4349 domain-containing protein [Oscillospiraceae bacterium]|nr:DUF4349 domain-containing protein [Oscillospiraceae bacterium]